MSLTFIETAAVTSKWLSSFSLHSLLPKLCCQVRHIITWQSGAAVIGDGFSTAVPVSWMPWIPHNIFSSHFWKRLDSHSLLFWLNPSTRTQPFSSDFSATSSSYLVSFPRPWRSVQNTLPSLRLLSGLIHTVPLGTSLC